MEIVASLVLTSMIKKLTPQPILCKYKDYWVFFVVLLRSVSVNFVLDLHFYTISKICLITLFVSNCLVCLNERFVTEWIWLIYFQLWCVLLWVNSKVKTIDCLLTVIIYYLYKSSCVVHIVFWVVLFRCFYVYLYISLSKLTLSIIYFIFLYRKRSVKDTWNI